MGLFDRMLKRESPQFAEDPVCHERVTIVSAPGGDSRHGHTIYYFCSVECRHKFDDDPHRWLGHHLH